MNIVEAAKCKSCGRPGFVDLSQRFESSDGQIYDVAIYRCPESLCLNYNGTWAVESDLQGNVPMRDHGPRGLDKDFPQMTSAELSKARIKLEETLQMEYDRDNPPEEFNPTKEEN